MSEFTRLRRQLTPSLVIATAALVVSLGGTAWAALVITGANVKNESLTGADVKNGSLAAVDLGTASVTLPKIAPATQAALRGATGPAGADGADGERGPAGAVSATVIRTSTSSLSIGSPGTAFASCTAGERVVGGGGRTGVVADAPITQSFPAIDGSTPVPSGGTANGWTVTTVNGTGGPITLTAFVVCAS